MDNSGIYAQIFLFSQKVYFGIFQHSNMRRKKTKKNFSHQHFWKVVGIVEDKCSSFSFQGKFGSTTAKFFDFMFQVTILDLIFLVSSCNKNFFVINAQYNRESDSHLKSGTRHYTSIMK